MLDFAITQLYRLILDDINIILDVYDEYLHYCQKNSKPGVVVKMTLKGFMEVQTYCISFNYLAGKLTIDISLSLGFSGYNCRRIE